MTPKPDYVIDRSQPQLSWAKLWWHNVKYVLLLGLIFGALLYWLIP